MRNVNKIILQVQRGMVDICILAVMKDKESYGYQIVKELEPYIEISQSTLYPVLRRLEADKLLTSHSETYNGRLRKYYSITGMGLECLEKFSEEWKELSLSINAILNR